MSGRAPGRAGPSWATALALLAILFFIAAASAFIPVIGTEDDELLFVPAVYHPEQALNTLRVGTHRLPLMLMTYVGGDKAILYRHLLSWLPPTMWTLRLPVALIGALTLWVLFLSVRSLAGEWIALALVWIMASDSIFLLTTVFDWGPVAIQHLFILTGFWLLARPEPRIFLGMMAFGVAFWDKGTAIWTIGALALAATVFFPGEIWKRVTRRNIWLTIAGGALGAAPILWFNVTHHWATFGENTVFSLDQFAQKMIIMWRSLRGDIMFDFLVRGAPPRWTSLSPWLIAAAAILALLPRARRYRRLALFSLFSAAAVWSSMLFVRNGGVSAHHAVLVWPWPHLFALLTIAAVLGDTVRGRAAFAVLCAAVVVSNCGLLVSYGIHAWQSGPTNTWSDAYLSLPEAYPNGSRVVTLDWGIQNMATYRSSGRTPVEDRTFSGLAGSDFPEMSRTEFLRHTSEAEIFHGNRDKFEAAVEQNGFRIVIDRVLKDSRGNPIVESLHCVPNRP